MHVRIATLVLLQISGEWYYDTEMSFVDVKLIIAILCNKFYKWSEFIIWIRINFLIVNKLEKKSIMIEYNIDCMLVYCVTIN